MEFGWVLSKCFVGLWHLCLGMGEERYLSLWLGRGRWSSGGGQWKLICFSNGALFGGEGRRSRTFG